MKSVDTLTRLVEAIENSVDRIQRSGEQLLRRAAIPVGGDGWPSHTGGASISTTGPSSETVTTYPTRSDGTMWHYRCTCGLDAGVYSNSHEAMSAATLHVATHASERTIDYADPTGETVANHAANQADPVSRSAERMMRYLARAERDLHRAVVELELSRPNSTPTLATDGDWCSNHLAYRMFEPRYRGDLCRACYDFQLAEKFLPDKPLLELRADGKHWTEATIAQARQRQRTRRSA